MLKTKKESHDDVGQIVVMKRTRWSEKALAKGLQNGDRGAVNALYEQYGGLVNRLIWRMVGSDDEHNDVVQNVFLGVIDACTQLNKPKSLKNWIISITVRTALKELRTRKYRHRFTPQMNLSDMSCGNAHTNDDDKLLVNGFYRVLRQLSAEMQVYIVLRYLEQQTNDEVAAACGVSVRTAKRRIAKAKRMFVAKAARDPFLGSLILDESNDEDQENL